MVATIYPNKYIYSGVKRETLVKSIDDITAKRRGCHGANPNDVGAAGLDASAPPQARGKGERCRIVHSGTSAKELPRGPLQKIVLHSGRRQHAGSRCIEDGRGGRPQRSVRRPRGRSNVVLVATGPRRRPLVLGPQEMSLYSTETNNNQRKTQQQKMLVVAPGSKLEACL